MGIKNYILSESSKGLVRIYQDGTIEPTSISIEDDEDYYSEMKDSQIVVDIASISNIEIGLRRGIITQKQFIKLYEQTGIQYFKSKKMYEISGDSGEYEFLTEAIELSKDVDGMCVEIGLRRGMGTKTIIDAVRQYCPDKTVVAVDPYGSIPYVGREHIGEIRLDYDNSMKTDAMVAMWTYIAENPVNFRYECLTDEAFFEKYSDGVPKYDIETSIETSYSMAHLDGPHNYEHVSKEIIWFNDRMSSSSVIVIDDVTPDFIDIAPIETLLASLGWELVRIGFKKGIWQKK